MDQRFQLKTVVKKKKDFLSEKYYRRVNCVSEIFINKNFRSNLCGEFKIWRKKKADLRRASDSLRFEHNEKGLTRLFMVRREKRKNSTILFPIHDQRNTYILRSTNEQWFSKSKKSSQDSEDNIQKEWETFAGEIRNTCVSIRIVRKWICSELLVCIYREIWLNWK